MTRRRPWLIVFGVIDLVVALSFFAIGDLASRLQLNYAVVGAAIGLIASILGRRGLSNRVVQTMMQSAAAIASVGLWIWLAWLLFASSISF